MPQDALETRLAGVFFVANNGERSRLAAGRRHERHNSVIAIPVDMEDYEWQT